MDYYRHFIYSLVARLFRAEYQSKFSTNRQLDSYSDRYCGYTCYITITWGRYPLVSLEGGSFEVIKSNYCTGH